MHFAPLEAILSLSYLFDVLTNMNAFVAGLLSIFLMFPIYAGLDPFYMDPHTRLVNDLMVVDTINKRLAERMPVYYNHLLYGGYINMPSAMMGEEGEIGIGFAYAPPYRLYNLRCQLTDRLEVAGNYRVFVGVKDEVLSEHGFGDFSDKGANFKIAILKPEDSGYELPGVAIGMEDFMGTRAFEANYIVLTKVFMNYDLEASIGYGTSRIRRWFGGLHWLPFRKFQSKYLNTLAFVAEYDSTPYKDESIEKHPKGRIKNSPLNFGVKYRLFDQFDFSASYIRGAEWSFTVSNYYNFGMTKGFVPKCDDTLPYRAPVNLEPLGQLRPENTMVQDLVYAFEDQGFTIFKIWLGYDNCSSKVLRLNIENEFYRQECLVRERLNHLLAFLTPSDIDRVIVTMEEDGFPLQEYNYNMMYVRQYGNGDLSGFELDTLTPMREVTFANPYYDQLLFSKNKGLYDWDILPKTSTYFGSSTGKFKYILGLNANLQGFLYDDIMYNISLGYIALRNNEDVKDFDRLNPSQLLNVRTDIVRYFQQDGVTLDSGYLQKNWTLGKGWFARATAGYFEVEYGGVAGELLYYPLSSHWAIGFEGAVINKRKYHGLGFTRKIRKLHGFVPTWKRWTLSQYFIDLYYEWKDAKLDFRIKTGKFLANDWGARFEISRYFPSGLRVTLWYTLTNGHDKVNGQTYYDKGASFSMPIDIFYTHSDRNRWGYGMSAWVRDVGVSAYTGRELYELINDQRN